MFIVADLVSLKYIWTLHTRYVVPKYENVNTNPGTRIKGSVRQMYAGRDAFVIVAHIRWN